ncbi:hypothetical protein FHW72_002360 [Ochrobactrum sp. RC6B]|uniref:Uncharacterized protein n=1 Tax=Brucella intermedia TaxID=94625 RepID=A0ABR6ATM5_9HYPH|nr:hypothetical protein [Brucella intermedia]MBB3217278.1 hypothetical protein [Ochrobactrum sp. RC6B]NYD80423.1 hypothetical protein [Brucella intermedia]
MEDIGALDRDPDNAYTIPRIANVLDWISSSGPASNVNG